MSGYTYEKQDNDYGLLGEGEYELQIERIEEKTLQSGKKKIAIMFRVRTDVEQPHKNRVLFEDIWQEKDTQYYNRKRINQLLGTQEIKDGTVFSTINDIIDTLKGANLKAKIVVSYDDYKGEDINRILFYMTTENGPQSIDSSASSGQSKATTTPVIDVTEDDLPF